MLGFWFGPVIVKNQQVAGTLGWWDPESYDCGSFVECRECRPTIMPHSPPFYRKLQMVHSCIDVSFYQPNVRGFLCNRWWLWLSTTDQCCVSIDIIAKFSAVPQCPQINNGRLFLFLAWRGHRYCDHSFVKDWAESGRGMSHGCVWPIQKCLDICTILYPQFDGFFLLFCTVAHCCTIVLVLLPNLNCRCFENGNLIHGSHWKLHVSPWCSSSFSLSALLAWHTGKKNIFFLAEVCFCSDMYVDFPAESIKWSMGVIMKSRQTKAKLGNIARKTGDIPHAIVLAYQYLPTKTRVIVEVVLSITAPVGWMNWDHCHGEFPEGKFRFPHFWLKQKVVKNP